MPSRGNSDRARSLSRGMKRMGGRFSSGSMDASIAGDRFVAEFKSLSLDDAQPMIWQDGGWLYGG